MENGYLNILDDDVRRHLSKIELFKRIQNNCRYKTKKSLVTGLIILLLIMAFFASFCLYGLNEPSVILAITLVIDGFISLGEYCLNKTMGKFDAPDKLMHWYDNDSIKMIRSIFAYLGIGMICYLIYYHISHSDINYSGLFLFILILVALVVMLIHLLYYGILKNKFNEDKDIRQLRDLLDGV